MTETFPDRLKVLCDTADRLTSGHVLNDTVADLRRRIDSPLRVAIAGRVKAGKSTLLNALVGERVAPTDAGECTRIVTWYRNAVGYEVIARLRDGSSQSLRFRRDERMLTISLDSLAPDDVGRLEVGWPSSRLEQMILIDTPGLESLDNQSSERTLRFLGLDEEGASDVDAVIYLMRHIHNRDADFLEAFMDRSLSQPSPVNAVSVLSRADEIGAGRLDALVSADRIAQRYRADQRIRALCATVIPVAGLIAETGSTLREDEMATLRTLVEMPDEELDSMLLSVDRFSDPARSQILPQTRRDLLSRLGLFGIRFSVAKLRSGNAATAADLSRRLISASGIDQLRRTLDEHFSGRARALKGRSVLVGLKSVARQLSLDRPDSGDELLAALEHVEATSHELSELRLWHLAVGEAVDLDEADLREIQLLTSSGSFTEQLGIDPDSPSSAVGEEALRRIERWRARADHPLADRDLQETCEIVVRSYEGIYAAASNISSD